MQESKRMGREPLFKFPWWISLQKSAAGTHMIEHKSHVYKIYRTDMRGSCHPYIELRNINHVQFPNRPKDVTGSQRTSWENIPCPPAANPCKLNCSNMNRCIPLSSYLPSRSTLELHRMLALPTALSSYLPASTKIRPDNQYASEINMIQIHCHREEKTIQTKTIIKRKYSLKRKHKPWYAKQQTINKRQFRRAGNNITCKTEERNRVRMLHFYVVCTYSWFTDAEARP